MTDSHASRRELARVALCWLAALALALSCPTSGSTQVSSSLGGDLSGKPSNARVVKVDGVPVDLDGGATGDVLTLQDGVIVPQEPAAGGGLSSLLLWTQSTTTSTFYVKDTTHVTACSFYIPVTDCVTGRRLDLLLSGTYNNTSTKNVRTLIYLDGASLSETGNQSVNAPSFVTKWRLSLALQTYYRNGSELAMAHGMTPAASIWSQGNAFTTVFPTFGAVEPINFGPVIPESVRQLLVEVCFRVSNVDGIWFPMTLDFGQAWMRR